MTWFWRNDRYRFLVPFADADGVFVGGWVIPDRERGYNYYREGYEPYGVEPTDGNLFTLDEAKEAVEGPYRCGVALKAEKSSTTSGTSGSDRPKQAGASTSMSVGTATPTSGGSSAAPSVPNPSRKGQTKGSPDA